MGVRTITAREANHAFSRVLNDVAAGAEFVVTRNGRPVARIVPEIASSRRDGLSPAQEWALAEFTATTWPLGVGRIDRDSLYMDKPDAPNTLP